MKWMLFTAVYPFGEHRLCGFAKQILLGCTPDFKPDRHTAGTLNNVMIQKWHATLNRMSHFHSITEQIKNVVR
jgi:hypothetical protein